MLNIEIPDNFLSVYFFLIHPVRRTQCSIFLLSDAGSSPPAVPSILTVAVGNALIGFQDVIPDTSSQIECSILCINSPGCLSFNYSESQSLCELSTATKDKQPEAYESREGFCYYEKVIPKENIIYLE